MILLLAPLGNAKATDYYLVGDWNGWDLKQTNFKLTPVPDRPNVYSIYINTPLNVKNSYAVGFIINTSDNTGAGWDQVLRPDATNSFVVDGRDYADLPALKTGGMANWQLKANPSARGNTTNGGAYLFTLDMSNPQQPKWSVRSMPDTRVLFVLGTMNNWQNDGTYLIDTNKDPNNYCNNYTGFAKLETGGYYKLCDGYDWYGSPTEEVQETVSTPSGDIHQKVSAGNNAQYAGHYNVNFTHPTNTYFLEANVMSLNDAGVKSFPDAASDGNRVIIKNAGTGAISRMKFRSLTHQTTPVEMTYDADRKVWYAEGIRLDDSEDYFFDCEFFNGTTTSTTSLPGANDPDGEGTYKAVYMTAHESGTGEAVGKLLLSVDLPLVNGVFIRTFSDNYARHIPEGLKAYTANGYSNGVVSLTSIADGIIPAGVGVVLIYDGTTTGIYFDPVSNGGVQTAASVSLEKAGLPGGTYTSNRLVKEIKAETLGPVTRRPDNSVATRNYYLANMDLDNDGTATTGFYRIRQEVGSGKVIRKAYLALDAAEQTDASNDDLAYTTADPTSPARRILMSFDGWDLFNNGETTGINSLKKVSEQDAPFYTLQGVKVQKPSKGVYIHRGKKIIIK